MNLLEQAYQNALIKNSEDTKLWTEYKKDHENLIKNLKEYQKNLTVDIMVPIGTKALMPGHLYHTSEVMICHGSGYFSDCTAVQGFEIAELRIKTANTHLEKLETERNMYKNNLEIPVVQDAFGHEPEEIIEEYEEETENKWRVEHKQRMKEHKQREAEERKQLSDTKADDDIMNMLDELEMMEELEDEIEDLNIADNEDLIKMMKGEMSITEQKRVSHVLKTETEAPALCSLDTEEIDYDKVETTDEESDESEAEISADFLALLETTKTCGKKQKIKIFRDKLKEIEAKMKSNTISLEERLNCSELYYEIQESLDFLEPAEGGEKKTNKIKFAEVDQVKFINKEEAVSKVESEKESAHTLELKITHSNVAEGAIIEAAGDDIKSPADIYRLFKDCIEHQEEVKSKSILKNRDMVYAETHLDQMAPKITKQPKKVCQVMGEVIENYPTEENTSKVVKSNKKVSKFKKSRAQ